MCAYLLNCKLFICFDLNLSRLLKSLLLDERDPFLLRRRQLLPLLALLLILFVAPMSCTSTSMCASILFGRGGGRSAPNPKVHRPGMNMWPCAGTRDRRSYGCNHVSVRRHRLRRQSRTCSKPRSAQTLCRTAGDGGQDASSSS